METKTKWRNFVQNLNTVFVKNITYIKINRRDVVQNSKMVSSVFIAKCNTLLYGVNINFIAHSGSTYAMTVLFQQPPASIDGKLF